MSHTPTLLQQLRSFCFENKINNIQTAIEYFAVFGGMGWQIDSSQPIETLIETKILNNYRYIHADITALTHNQHHKLLSALAMGNQQEHSAFRKVALPRKKGEEAIDFLVEQEILRLHNSVEPPFDTREVVSDKLHFIRPFMRFWFGFISPYYQSIKEGDYREFRSIWSHHKQSFSNLIYQQLLIQQLKIQTTHDSFQRIAQYWDKSIQIDIVGKYKSGRRIAGACHFAQSKASKKELNKLQQKIKDAKLESDEWLIFSKSKFSSELKKEKSNGVRLLSPKSLTPLIANLTPKDAIEVEGKRY